MREIKFRSKRIDNGEWVYGSLLQSEIDVNRIAVRCQIHERFADDFSIAAHDVIPETVGQYTGKKDKNGKEIYEGDIVQLYRHDDYKKYTYKHEKAEVWADGKYQPDIKEVKFMYGSFVIWSDLIRDYRCFANLARPGESLEVIGNRFENPELLSPTPSQEAKD